MSDATNTPKIAPSSASLVAQAEAYVGHVDVASAADMLKVTDVRFIDVRDVRELGRTGRIPGAKHCPRGMLEFWIDQESPYHKPLFAEDATFVFYCASGWRSALAAQTAKQMGLQKVTHLKGGITAWIETGKPTEARETS
ncbi:rhodanese-like domain-containing protein [Ahrensia marina]|uniref:rhodanese-like domain-containing protein n=1 Tax=Ahrensia marina TaxID=1514904 RepID=UPI0035D0C722